MTSINTHRFTFKETVEDVRFIPFQTVWRFVVAALLTALISYLLGRYVRALDVDHNGIFVLAFLFFIFSVLSDFNYLYSWRVRRGWSFWQSNDSGEIMPAEGIGFRVSDLIAIPPTIRLEIHFRKQPFRWRGRIAKIELSLPRRPTAEDVAELFRIREQIIHQGVADFSRLEPLKHVALLLHPL